jgi:predicted lipopolysaccharide heptosyltransferase III
MTQNPEILTSSDPQISRILLVRLRQIGDVVFTTPAIRALRRKFPDAHISYIVEPAAVPIVEHNPHLSDVVVAPRQRGVAGLRTDVELIRRLRVVRYDVAIDFHGGPRASLLTWLSGAPRRIGYDVVGRSWMYTDRVRRPRELRPRHSVQNQFDLLAPLGIGPADPAIDSVEMRPGDEAVRSVRERLAAAGVPPSARLIVVHVSSNSPFRRWPAESFATAIASLAGSVDDGRIVVTAGPSETGAVDRIIADVRARSSAAAAERVLRCGEFSLAELRALVDAAALYIGGDSGPLHIASASAVPIVALYGPTLPVRSHPWRSSTVPSEAVDAGDLPCRPCDQRVCAPGDFRCLTRIGPEAVVTAAHRLLAARS